VHAKPTGRESSERRLVTARLSGMLAVAGNPAVSRCFADPTIRFDGVADLERLAL
jgi:hypothetical protein